jgi:hypothetical protein
MNWNAAAGQWDISVPVNVDATQLDMVFHDGSGTWDNNGSQDWHFEVTGAQAPSFVMDGQLDSTAQEVAANGSRHLYAAIDGDTLYVATEDAGEGDDVFIYLAETPGALTAANWAKAGLVAGWDAYLADENDNDYEGWFDVTGSHDAATGANGGVLEGILNLAEEFGSLPTEIYLAVGVYQTGDGGALVSSLQVPGSVNFDGNLDGIEYFLLQLVATPGDYDRDGDVDDDDFLLWRDTFESTTDLRADGNGDHVVDAADYTVWRDHFATGGNAAYVLTHINAPPAARVPEPTSIGLLLAGVVMLTTGAKRVSL